MVNGAPSRYGVMPLGMSVMQWRSSRRRSAAEVPAILNDPQLTAERAKRVYELVETGAKQFEALLTEMDRDSALRHGQLKTAERLMDIWTSLAAVAANKVRTVSP